MFENTEYTKSRSTLGLLAVAGTITVRVVALPAFIWASASASVASPTTAPLAKSIQSEVVLVDQPVRLKSFVPPGAIRGTGPRSAATL